MPGRVDDPVPAVGAIVGVGGGQQLRCGRDGQRQLTPPKAFCLQIEQDGVDGPMVEVARRRPEQVDDGDQRQRQQ
jgi:hypothetical protein